MRQSFADWLRHKDYRAKTVANHLAQAARVEAAYGDLDDLFAADELGTVIDALRYSTDDERRGRPNPSLVPLVGVVLRTNLASYRSSVRLYRAYRRGEAKTGP